MRSAQADHPTGLLTLHAARIEKTMNLQGPGNFARDRADRTKQKTRRGFPAGRNSQVSIS
jgi:hypothetical protein